jgi:hypothetical protein
LSFRDPIAATDNVVDASVDSTGDWRRDTFQLLEHLLGAAFGLGRDEIPLASDGRIDPGTWA